MKLFFLFLSVIFIHSKYNDTVQKIYSLLMKEQAEKTHDFSIFPPHWAQNKGEFNSYIHFNFVGGKVADEVRNKFRFPDMNMFVTNFIEIILLEMHEMKVINVDKTRIKNGVEAILKYQDKNFETKTPIYRFWPLKKVDQTWISYPTNLKEFTNSFPTFCDGLEWILLFLDLKKYEEFLKEECDKLEEMVSAFHIPPDIDDAFCNVALGSLLSKNQKDFPDSYGEFSTANIHYDVLFDSVSRKYSYRPFEESSDNTKIDPRTYMFAHEYLEKMEQEGRINGEKPDISLPTTWLMNIEENRKVFPLEGMPFNVNNLDLNVATNYLFGSTYFFLYHDKGSKAFITKDMKNTYLNSAKYLEWAINSREVTRRPDIALTYYPNVFDMYWFVSRTTFLLENHPNSTFPFDEMEEVRDIFVSLVKNEMTDSIIGSAHFEGSIAYWDDFLGDQGTKHLGEDRLFSTALCINSLIDIWTKIDSSIGESKRYWRDDTPDSIKDVIIMGLEYINKNVLNKKQSLENAFFSGSVKSFRSLPFFYPGNFYEFLNGTKITSWPPEDMSLMTNDLIPAMDGVIDKDTYENWKKLRFFTQIPPTEDTGFSDVFPYWSSKAMTYAVSMFALSKYDIIEE